MDQDAPIQRIIRIGQANVGLLGLDSALASVLQETSKNTDQAVAYLFEKVGLITLEKPADIQAAILSIMDLGVENVEETEQTIEVYTQPQQLEAVAQKLQSAGYKLKEKELFLEPKTTVEVKAKDKQGKVVKLMELLEEHDDVQKVFANFDFVD